MELTIRSAAPLAHGGSIPRLGLGVFRAGAETQRAVEHALAVGYRHVDTAAIYGNEEDVGRGLRASGVSRDDVFVTTKLWNDDHGFEAPLRAFDRSLRRLGLDWVDLYLIHWPVQHARLETWRALERLHHEGRARAIGVSNYMVHHLREVLAACEVRPAVNQIELHPFNAGSRADVLELCADRGIHPVAYSPLTKGRRLDDPRLAALAAETGRTVAQVLLRWGLERGFVVIPKSSDPGRIEQNAALYDFELTDAQRARLDAMDEGLATAWDPTRAP